MSDSNFSILLPSYEDKKSTLKTLTKISELSLDVKIILIEDGSIIDPIRLSDLQLIKGISGHLLTLKQNMGHQRALAVGMLFSTEKYSNKNLILMDSDGEDAPESIIKLMTELNDSNVEIVVAQRTTRDASLKFKSLYFMYKIIYKILSGLTMDFGNFCAMTPRAARRIVSMPETWIHIGSTILISKLAIKRVPTPRGSRYFGTGKYSINTLVQHGLRSLIVLSDFIISRLLLAYFGVLLALFFLFPISLIFNLGFLTDFVQGNVYKFLIIELFFNPIIIIFFVGGLKFGHLEKNSNYQNYVESIESF